MTPPFRLVEGEDRPYCQECGHAILDGDRYIYYPPLRATHGSPAESAYIAHHQCPDICCFCGDQDCESDEPECMLARMGYI